VESHLERLLSRDIPELVYALGRALMEMVLVQARGFHGSRLECDQCSGGHLEYQGDTPRTIKTRLGDVSVRRAYYHCSCGHSAFPLDTLLGLDGEHGVMPDLQEEMALMASKSSYPEALRTLTRLLPVQTSLRTLERVTATVAGQVQQEQQRELREAFEDPTCARLPEPETTEVAPVAVVAADGGMCPMRGREEPHREFKMGVMGRLDPEPGAEETAEVTDKRYVAHLGGPDRVFELMSLEYHRLGLHLSPLLHVLGDGSPWLWNRFGLLRQPHQEFSELLDFFHAAEHVGTVAGTSFGAETPESKAWSHAMRTNLKEGRLPEFFSALEDLEQQARDEGRSEVAEVMREELAYFSERRPLLRYKECLERGLPIGSGMIEGGIRFVGKDRLDRTGMRWGEPGAEQILQLRCLDTSDRWDTFFQTASARRQDRYQAAKRQWLKAA
jgi:hypothetical protein